MSDEGVQLVHMDAGAVVRESDGLILTNHHVAFEAVQRASTQGVDYLTDGFLADSGEAEVEALTRLVVTDAEGRRLPGFELEGVPRAPAWTAPFRGDAP